MSSKSTLLVIKNNLSNMNNVSVAYDNGLNCCVFPRRPPFVLDPANPTNNVCSASDAEGWKIAANVANMTLQRQPLRDINFKKNWKIKKSRHS